MKNVRRYKKYIMLLPVTILCVLFFSTSILAKNVYLVRGNKIVYTNYISEANENYGTYQYYVTEDADDIAHTAYCVNANQAAKTSEEHYNAEEVPMTEQKNIDLFKVLYYGYDGNGDVTSSFWPTLDNDGRFLYTHIAAGIIYSDSDNYKGISKDIADSYQITAFISYATSQPLPADAKLMLIPSTEGDDGEWEQGIAYILSTQNVEAVGGIKITKKGSVLTSFTDGQFIWEDGGIPGVEFELIAGEDLSYGGVVRYSNGSKITTDLDGEKLNLTTNKKGKITIDNIPLGKYKIKEKDAPSGYMTDVEVKEGTVTTAKPIKKFSVYDNRQNIKLAVQKIDAKSEEKLSGGNFKLIADQDITNVRGEVIVTKGTLLAEAPAKDGNIKFGLDLPFAKYKIKEDIAPADYFKLEEPIHIDLSTPPDKSVETLEKKVVITNRQLPHFADLSLRVNNATFEKSSNYQTGDIGVDGYSILLTKETDKEESNTNFAYVGVFGIIMILLTVSEFVISKLKKQKK